MDEKVVPGSVNLEHRVTNYSSYDSYEAGTAGQLEHRYAARSAAATVVLHALLQ